MQQISTCSRTARLSIMVQVITAGISGITHDKRRHYPSALRVRVSLTKETRSEISQKEMEILTLISPLPFQNVIAKKYKRQLGPQQKKKKYRQQFLI